MAKERTETTLREALKGRAPPLSGVEAKVIYEAARCARATFFRSNAYREFLKTAEAPVPAVKKTTKDTLTKLRGAVKVLANCVQTLSLRIESQDKELATLRQLANDNVTPFRPVRQRRT